MDVDTRLLRYFAAVAGEGNLTRAAERLFVSQPALTKQIKHLESQLGVQLFIRSRAGMTLTAAGQALDARVPAMLAGWDEALQEAKSADSQAAPDDELTAIANGDSITLAPESAARYYAHPGITYQPVTGVSPSQVGVAWSPAAGTNPVIQDFIRCCLDNKPLQDPDSLT